MATNQVFTAYLPDRETAHDLSHVANQHRRRAFPQTEDAKAEFEELLPYFKREVDVLSAQALAVAAEADGI